MRAGGPLHRRTAPRLACMASTLRVRRCLPSPLMAVSSASSSSSSSTLCAARRALSQQARRWLNKHRYGADDAPTMGSWECAYEGDAMDARKAYCKALVYASGGSRLARDWIAGCAALTSPDPSLIFTALQYNATEVDLLEWREYILRRLLGEEAVGSGGGASGVHIGDEYRFDSSDDGETEVVATRMADADAAAGIMDDRASRSGPPVGQQLRDGQDGDAHDVLDDGESTVAIPPTPERIRAAEGTVLQSSPEARCFLYDAMAASLFHSNSELRAVEAARRRTFAIGSAHFGLPFEELTALWRVVEAELLLKKEKVKVLGQPWGE